MNGLKNTEIVSLWLLRLFKDRKTFRLLVKDGHFRDDDVASAIGLDHWVDVDNFSRNAIRREMLLLQEDLEKQYQQNGYNPKLKQNFSIVRNLIGLNEEEVEISIFLAFLTNYQPLHDAFNIVEDRIDWTFERFIGDSLCIPKNRVKNALGSSGRLMSSGFLVNPSHRRFKIPELFSETLSQGLLSETVDEKTVFNEILVQPDPPQLNYTDFQYMNPVLKNLRTYLKRSVQTKAKGVNILLYGPPGTGKTQLSRLLAREVRCSGYEIRAEDSDGSALHPDKQFARLRLAKRLLSNRSLIIVDEAEDIFSGDISERAAVGGHKGLLHKMLETNPIPVIWITNSLGGFSAANIRRFDSVLKIDNPPPEQRERVIRRICGQSISKSLTRRLSLAEHLSPAVLSRAHAFASVICESESPKQWDQVIEEQIQNTLSAQHYKGIPASSAKDANGAIVLPDIYDPSFVNTSSNLEKLADNLLKNQRGRICIYGPPGTGKTSFAHHVARRVKCPVHVHRVSDLQSPYVGVCEKNIAKAFARAQSQKAILVLDEVDTFLSNRAKANSNWEVSQVNEFLTQLEAYEGIFFATTNLIDSLDPAAMRRFDLKLLFDFMKPEQAEHLFRLHCRSLKIGTPRKADSFDIFNCTSLTPGDFANVSSQHRLQPIESPRDFADRLLNEVNLKGAHASSRPIGFCAA